MNSLFNKNKERDYSLSYFIKKWSIAILLIGIVLSLLWMVQTYNRALRMPYGNDFTLFLQISEIFFNGGNPYGNHSVFTYLYPQTLCILIYPLTLINYKIAILIWFVFSLLCLYFSYLEIIKFLKVKLSTKENLLYFSLLCGILFSIIQDNLLNGQINFLILYLVILFFKFHQKNYFLSAIFLSLAISIKVTPLIFIAFLFFNKKIKTIFFTLILSTIFILILPFLLIDYGIVLANYQDYLNQFILDRTQNFNPKQLHAGYSLTMFISDFFGKYSIFISLFLSIIYLVYMQFIKDNPFLIFSGYLLAIILVSPMSEQHHLILLFPILIFLLSSIRPIGIGIVLIFILLSSIKPPHYMMFIGLILLKIGIIINSKPYLKSIRSKSYG